MTPSRCLRSVLLATAFGCFATCSPAARDESLPRRTLAAYAGEAELGAALARWRAAAAKLQSRQRRELEVLKSSAPGAVAQPAPATVAENGSAADAGKADASITNVQTAGVDEGGIVKRAGDYLVVLRRGRLFTVRIGADALQPVAMSDAYAPDVSASGAWYDELLVAGRTVVVIGYSYQRGGTEIGLFDLGADGGLAYRATYHLRSFDYYSSRNYASRLIGNKLVFYTPTYLQASVQPGDVLPALRRWHPGALPSEFQRILPATRIYRTDDDFDPGEPLALHTVTSCDLASAELQCESTAVLGPAGRVFYVAQGSVYVWTSTWGACRRERSGAGCARSALFRLPLDGSAPSAIKTAGVPIDQMSFLEDDGNHVNVLLRESGRGEAMWGSERTRGGTALLRVPLSAFGDGSAVARRSDYRELPQASGDAVQNRFVGEWLLWGGDAAATPAGREANAWAVRYRQPGPVQALAPGHAVERIEAMGSDALLVGNAGQDLRFTSVRLQDGQAAIAGQYVHAGASQGESRSHGFFYKAVAARDGIVGLPMLEPASPRKWFDHGQGGEHGSASVLFLRQRDLAFTALGRLDARPGRAADDGCVASCVDWYGNARPIFIGERVFALLGYELVEGRLGADRSAAPTLVERRRIGFAPAELARAGR